MSITFLEEIGGLIHIGANTGQERDLYGKHQLKVVWVEPIIDVFEELRENLYNYPDQKGYNALITDKDDQEYDFYIANNFGASSSILPLKECYKIWPEIHYINKIKIKSCTLPTMILTEGLKIQDYQALIMDTQGSELLILKGAESMLNHFDYIKTEVADFEAYKGCVLIGEMTNFLEKQGFYKAEENMFAADNEGLCHYFDVIYKRNK